MLPNVDIKLEAYASSLERNVEELFVEFNSPFTWNVTKLCGSDWPKANQPLTTRKMGTLSCYLV